uniref:Ndc10 domain-containing protein n=1 Tax=Globisporangium ultimum (strain ATCC 200006 / CBS 805.95 / DAOM BR144) TaxID=431595 RepID=K3W8H9_GLOUD
MPGFAPQKGTYFIERDSVQLPKNMLQMVFPQAQILLKDVEEGESKYSTAAVGFLQLLLYLRKVILQDAVLLMTVYPQHPI